MTRRLILTLSLLGTLAFGGGWLLSFVDPLLIERAAREVVRQEVERRVGERIDRLIDSRPVRLGERAMGRSDAELDPLRARLRDEAARRVAQVASDMLRRDCPCRERLRAWLTASEAQASSSLAQIRERLTSLAETSYASVRQHLLREFRIVTASNAVAFALMGLVALALPRSARPLVLTAAVLLTAVGLTTGLYLFQQNWLHTLVFGDYVGLAYAGYLGLVALLLTDVAFNRARVTTGVLDAAGQVAGSALGALGG